MTRPDVLDEIAVVSSICRELGLGEVTFANLKSAHRATFLISPLDIVATVRSTEPVNAAWRRAAGE